MLNSSIEIHSYDVFVIRKIKANDSCVSCKPVGSSKLTDSHLYSCCFDP